jgi:hypothetical protein
VKAGDENEIDAGLVVVELSPCVLDCLKMILQQSHQPPYSLSGILHLLASGIDHVVGAIVSAVVVFYFGHGAYEKQRNSKRPR